MGHLYFREGCNRSNACPGICLILMHVAGLAIYCFVRQGMLLISSIRVLAFLVFLEVIPVKHCTLFHCSRKLLSTGEEGPLLPP